MSLIIQTSVFAKKINITFSVVILMLDLWFRFDEHEITIQQFFDDVQFEPNQVQSDEFGKVYEIP